MKGAGAPLPTHSYLEFFSHKVIQLFSMGQEPRAHFRLFVHTIKKQALWNLVSGPDHETTSDVLISLVKNHTKVNCNLVN